jgi:hypothetical protein
LNSARFAFVPAACKFCNGKPCNRRRQSLLCPLPLRERAAPSFQRGRSGEGFASAIPMPPPHPNTPTARPRCPLSQGVKQLFRVSCFSLQYHRSMTPVLGPVRTGAADRQRFGGHPYRSVIVGHGLPGGRNHINDNGTALQSGSTHRFHVSRPLRMGTSDASLQGNGTTLTTKPYRRSSASRALRACQRHADGCSARARRACR